MCIGSLIFLFLFFFGLILLVDIAHQFLDDLFGVHFEVLQIELLCFVVAFDFVHGFEFADVHGGEDRFHVVIDLFRVDDFFVGLV